MGIMPLSMPCITTPWLHAQPWCCLRMTLVPLQYRKLKWRAFWPRCWCFHSLFEMLSCSQFSTN
jgi:hypothetical protein